MVGIIPAWVHQPVKPALPPHIGNQQHHEGSDRKAEHQKQESDRKFTHGSLHLQFDKDKANLLPEKNRPPNLGPLVQLSGLLGHKYNVLQDLRQAVQTGSIQKSRSRSRNTPRPPWNRRKIDLMQPPWNRIMWIARRPSQSRTGIVPAASGLQPAVSEPHGNRPGRLGPPAGRLRAV